MADHLSPEPACNQTVYYGKSLDCRLAWSAEKARFISPANRGSATSCVYTRVVRMSA